MKKFNERVLTDEVEITLENLELLSKIFALIAVKHAKKYAYAATPKVEKMHKQLQYDIFYHKQLEPYSTAYDFVQEACMFLFAHLGMKLGKICPNKFARNGQHDTVRTACFKHVEKCVRSELNFSNNTASFDGFEDVAKVNDNEEETPVNYTKIRAVLKVIIQNKTDMQISRNLEKENISTKGRKLIPETIMCMLKREIYTGILRINNKDYDKIYPQIISKELYDQVQKNLDANRYSCRKDNHATFQLKDKMRVLQSKNVSNNSRFMQLKNTKILQLHNDKERQLLQQKNLQGFHQKCCEEFLITQFNNSKHQFKACE